MTFRTADRWFFDAWAQGYDLAIPQRLAYRPVHDAVLQAFDRDMHARRVLDVGCGTGELVRRIIEEFPAVHAIGCDFSDGMLQHATAKGRRARWVQGDACRLPFRDASFDAVVSTEAFHWFPDQDAALREFHRVLVPGGRLLLALASPPLALFSALASVGSRLVGEPFYWPTPGETRRQLARAGFQVGEQRRVFRFPGLLLMPVLTSAVRPGRSETPRRVASQRRAGR